MHLNLPRVRFKRCGGSKQTVLREKLAHKAEDNIGLSQTTQSIVIIISKFLSKHLFNESVFFFVATCILDVRQFVNMLWFMNLYYEFSIVVLSLFFLCCYFNLSTFHLQGFACNFPDWGCVILREIDFLLKICWSIPCLHPSRKVHTRIEICASFNHRKKTKADGSQLIPRKHTETLVLLSVANFKDHKKFTWNDTFNGIPNRNIIW